MKSIKRGVIGDIRDDFRQNTERFSMESLIISVTIVHLLFFARVCYGVKCMVCRQDVQLNDHPYCGHAWIPEANRYITKCEEAPPGQPPWNRCIKFIFEELSNGDTYYVRRCGDALAMNGKIGCMRWKENSYGFDIEYCVCEGDICNRDMIYREIAPSGTRVSERDSWLLMCLSCASILFSHSWMQSLLRIS